MSKLRIGTTTALERRHEYARSASRDSRGVKLTYRYLLWIFLICSVIGLVVETLISIPIDGEFRHRAGLMWGPFSPIYGLGAVLLTIALKPLDDRNPLVQYLVACIVGATFEGIAGWLWKNAFGFVSWSYIDQPFNIGGYTCLGMALVWGLAGMAWIKILFPLVIECVDRIPQNINEVLTKAFTVFLAIDVAVTIVAFDCWYKRAANIAVETPMQQLCDTYFDDDVMAVQFQIISLHPELASRD